MTEVNNTKGGRPKGGDRLAGQIMATLQQFDAMLANEALSLEHRAELVKEKSQLLRASAERQASREMHERHKQKQQRRRLREEPPAPIPQGQPLTTAQIVELMRRGLPATAAQPTQNGVQQ